MAVLVFLAAAARAGIVATHARHGQRGASGRRGHAACGGLGHALGLAGLGGRGVGHVADALAARLEVLRGLLDLLAGLDAHGHQRARDVVLDHVEQLAEQLEGLALVFLLGLLLAVAAQVNALAQVVERGQVLAPVHVDALQQHGALEGVKVFTADLLQAPGVALVGRVHDLLGNVLVGDGAGGLDLLGQRQIELPLLGQHFFEAGDVPLLLDRLGRHVLARQIGHAALAEGGDLLAQVGGVQDFVALLVDHLALVVGHVVVLEQLLADVEVACLDLALRALDAARDDARFDRLALGHLQPVHDGAHAVAREDAHQRIVQAEVKARRTRVTLAARAPAQLVVDAPALVALGGDDAQAAQGNHLGVILFPLGAQLGGARAAGGLVQRRVLRQRLDGLVHVAAQHDVGAATGHVGGDGDHLGPAGLRHDVGLARVLLGVEHLVRQLGLLQQLGDDFGVLDRRCAHQHRLTLVVAGADVGDGGGVFLGRGLVDAVELVVALAGPVGRDHHGLQAVDFLELVGLGVGRAGHARQLAVEAKVVLEGDRGQSLVLGLDGHALLGLHRLVQAVAPAPPAHQAAGELVDDDDLGALLAGLHHVVLVAVKQVMRAQGRIQVVHQRDVGRVVQAGAGGDQAPLDQHALGGFVALLGQVDLVRFFIDREVARLGHALAGARVGLALLAHQQRRDLVHGLVHGGVVLGLAADDQRRARLVDQDRVHLVDDGVVQLALHAIGHLVDHVVTQVVEAILVVGAVGDVGVVGGLLLLARHLRQVHAHRQAQEVVQPPHPLRVAIGQVVVDGDHVHALALKCVQVHRQRGRERLALAGAHLGDLALVQRHAAHQLHVEVAHLHDALGGFAHHGKRLGQQLVQRLAGSQAVTKLLGLATQFVVAELLKVGFERVDAGRDFAVLLEQAVVATAENLGEEGRGHA